MRPAVPLVLSLSILFPAVGGAASLRPSHAGLLRQVHAARDHGYVYAYDRDDVERMVRAGELVRVEGNRDYVVKGAVRYPFARPEVELFVQRLGQQYHQACGRRLVVTSLIRPRNEQPRNASPLSVHPTGMAMDLRVSSSRSCRSWLERALLHLEDGKLLEAAREHHPPHYHVVLFPAPYLGYVAAKDGAAAVDGYRSPTGVLTADAGGAEYRVRRGDSLWTIARRFGTTTGAIERANGLVSSRIKPGQVLAIPGRGGAAAQVAAVDATSGASGPAGGDATYRVRPGDNLWTISRRFGTTTASLRQANGLASSRIKPGQVLTVPARGGTTFASYQVRRGDNLWAIARRHGTSPGDLKRMNGLASSRIKPGQVLTVPAGAR